MKKYLIALVVVVLLVIIAVAVYLKLSSPLITVPGPVACTMEAKLCPDGVTSVGRQGPNCEFAECPAAQAVDEMADWKTYKNEEYGFELKYPENYKLADDRYGWPKAIALFGGPSGQSYYLAVEIWNNESEISQDSSRKYQLKNITIRPLGDKFVTLWNVNQDQLVDQIISTFKFTK